MKPGPGTRRGLKPQSIFGLDAALKRRSSTVAQAFATFSAACEAVSAHRCLGGTTEVVPFPC
jgi:hypothetical protein